MRKFQDSHASFPGAKAVICFIFLAFWISSCNHASSFDEFKPDSPAGKIDNIYIKGNRLQDIRLAKKILNSTGIRVVPKGYSKPDAILEINVFTSRLKDIKFGPYLDGLVQVTGSALLISNEEIVSGKYISLLKRVQPDEPLITDNKTYQSDFSTPYVIQGILQTLADSGRIDTVLEAIYKFKNSKYEDQIISIKGIKALGETKKHELIPIYVELLDEDSYRIREAAVIALGLMESNDVIQPLKTALDDTEVPVRHSTLLALENINTFESVLCLIDAFNDDSAYIRRTAAEITGGYENPKIADALITLLDDRDVYVRRAAIEAIAKTGNSQIVDSLTGLINDEDQVVMENTIKALGSLAPEKTFDLLLKALEDKIAVSSTVYILGEIGHEDAVEPLIRLLDNQWYMKEVAEALGKIGDKRAVKPLIDVLWKAKWGQEKAIYAALNQIGVGSEIDYVIPYLNNEDRNIRAKAARLLGEVGDSSVEEYLIKLLYDKEASVREQASIGLGKIGDDDTVLKLMQILEQNNPEIQREIIRALNVLGGKLSAEILAHFTINDKDESVRWHAMEALARTKEPITFKTLVKCLDDDYHSIRRDAVYFLGRSGNPTAYEYLVKMLNDPADNVRSSAASALAKLGDKRAFNRIVNQIKIEPYDHTIKYMLESLAELDSKQTVPIARQYLLHEDQSVRMTVIDILAKHGGPSSIRPLKEASEKFNDTSWFNDPDRAIYEIENRCFNELFDQIETELMSKSPVKNIHGLMEPFKCNYFADRDEAAQIFGTIVDPVIIMILFDAVMQDKYVVKDFASHAYTYMLIQNRDLKQMKNDLGY